MFRVGLTGGIASGKTTVCRYFTALGIEVFDADDLARELVQVNTPCYQQIIKQFGSSILLADRNLDRRQLRALIFSDPQAKQALEAILHPAIHTELMARSTLSQSDYCMLAIPLLADSKMSYPLNRVLVIDTGPEQQLQRLCKRDSLSVDTAQAMINQQSSRADNIAISDDIIHNDLGVDALKDQVVLLHQHYLQLAKQAAIVAS
jgi:dephospho-CoA kinase